MSPIQPVLTLVRGVSNNGKSTFAEAMNRGTVISADDYFMDSWGLYDFDVSKLPDAHKECQCRCDMLMHVGADVVVANTFTREWEMEPYFKLAKDYGYAIFTIIVENRHGGLNDHGVPEEAVQKMRDRFEIKL